MKKCISLMLSAAIVVVSNSRVFADETPALIYAADPQHLWNRLHSALWDRVGPDGRIYGRDRLDPLLWYQTRHLLEGPSRDAALELLREFLDSHGETLIDDPLKRALLQRDLWAIFDWLANPHADENYNPIGEEAQGLLRRPLAQVIERLALDAETIDTLPDMYAAAVASGEFPGAFDPAQPQASFLPPDLFDPDGPWVCIGRNGSDIIVPAHTESFSRSSFQVFLNLPEGREATTEYLNALSSFKEPFRLEPLSDGRFVKRTNPALPQFSDGTQVALVRSALLIDSRLHLRPTNLIESVQLRVFRDARSKENYEFTLSRALLIAGTAGGLHAVAIDERDFLTSINPHSADEFELSRNATGEGLDRRMHVVRQRCNSCHREPGVHSFNTFVGGFSPPELLPSLSDTGTTERGETAAIKYKQTRYDWGLLEGLLINAHESASPRP
ncbi:MAG: hypothetical protein ACKVT0_01325 [Planctomycetaceae bacterium]